MLSSLLYGILSVILVSVALVAGGAPAGSWTVVKNPSNNALLVQAVASAMNQTNLLPRSTPTSYTYSILTAKSQVVAGISWNVTVVAQKIALPRNCTVIEFLLWHQPWRQSVRIMQQEVKSKKCPKTSISRSRSPSSRPTGSPTFPPVDDYSYEGVLDPPSLAPSQSPPTATKTTRTTTTTTTTTNTNNNSNSQ